MSHDVIFFVEIFWLFFHSVSNSLDFAGYIPMPSFNMLPVFPLFVVYFCTKLPQNLAACFLPHSFCGSGIQEWLAEWFWLRVC